MISFEWDKAWAKSVFFDEFATQFYDDSHSQLEEDRFLILGPSTESNVSLVCDCERKGGEIIRLISARKAARSELKHYIGDSKSKMNMIYQQ